MHFLQYRSVPQIPPHLAVELHTHEFYLQRVLPEVGVVTVHMGLDGGLLVECFESLLLYYGIVSSKKGILYAYSC